MYVRSGDQDFLGAPGSEKSLRYREILQKSQTATAHIEGIAVFPQAKFAVKNGRKGRIGVMGLAGGNDPVQTVGILAGIVEKLLTSFGAEGTFVFMFGGMREGDDTGTTFQLAFRHAKGVIDFFGWHDARTEGAGRTHYVDISNAQSWDLL